MPSAPFFNARRRFIKTQTCRLGAFGALGLLSACGGGDDAVAAPTPTPTPGSLPSVWRMPDEGEPHRATWMSFGASEAIWGRQLLAGVRGNLALIAKAVAAYEPVHMLVRAEEQELAAKLCGPSVNLHVQALDDLWMRDSGAVFVQGRGQERGAVDFNFNGWGNKQAFQRDAKVAAMMAAKTSAPLIKTSLVLEGGGIEVDGAGTALITESCVLNANRNPGLSKQACEAELLRVLGIQKVIWLPGIAGRDITDGHTDFYARFAGPGVVVAGLDDDPSSYDYAVTRKHLEILRQSKDAQGRALKVVVMSGPASVRRQYENDAFAAGYINFYVCNGAVIAPEFGDLQADRNCRDLLRDLFPKREIVQLNIDAIAAGGGGIHCTTQQQGV